MTDFNVSGFTKAWIDSSHNAVHARCVAHIVAQKTAPPERSQTRSLAVAKMGWRYESGFERFGNSLAGLFIGAFIEVLLVAPKQQAPRTASVK